MTTIGFEFFLRIAEKQTMGQTQFNETKAYLRLILGTFSVLAVLTAVNVLIILNALGTDVFKPFQRNIAAVSTAPVKIVEKIQSPIIEINCRKKIDVLRVKTKAPSARIFFKNCKQVGRLVNQSNQNQGDIFPLKKNLLTSDFIFLNEGENSIVAPIGESIQRIEITREVTKSPDLDKAL